MDFTKRQIEIIDASKYLIGKKKDIVLSLAVFLLIVGGAILLEQVFSDRAALIHVGAIIGSMMVGNVFFIIIPNQKKVVAEPTLANNIVYYPIYKPNTSSLGCGEGDALICAVDADCGYNRSSELDDSGVTAKTDCYKVGVGVLSKLVIFGKKLYANISGKTDEKKAKTDIVIINALDSDNLNLRSSWRENF